MSVLVDLLEGHFSSTFELAKKPTDPFKFDRQLFKAKELASNTAQYFDKIAWYKGRIKAGYGVLEDSDCFVAWHKKCPVIVPIPNKDENSADASVNDYFSFMICGHMSGAARTLIGAVQAAAMHAIELDGDTSESDSRWLQRGKKAFFEFHAVDVDVDKRFNFTEVSEHLAALDYSERSALSL